LYRVIGQGLPKSYLLQATSKSIEKFFTLLPKNVFLTTAVYFLAGTGWALAYTKIIAQGGAS
jgi:hypothetical protein